jgi:hypothetical protein
VAKLPEGVKAMKNRPRDLLILIILLLAGTAEAGTFWTETWDEPAPFSNWIPNCPECVDPNTGEAGAIDLGSGQGLNGTNAVRWTYNDLNTGGGPFMDRYGINLTSRVFWLTWWDRFSTGFQCSTSDTKLFQLFAYADYPAFTPGCVGGSLAIFVNGSKSLNGDTEVVYTSVSPNSDSQFHCYELNVIYNTPGNSDGSVFVYRDGTQVGSMTGKQFTWNGGEPFCVANGVPCDPNSRIQLVRLYRERGMGQRYTDNLSIGDTRVGCTGAVTSPTPSSPTGVSLQ